MIKETNRNSLVYLRLQKIKKNMRKFSNSRRDRFNEEGGGVGDQLLVPNEPVVFEK